MRVTTPLKKGLIASSLLAPVVLQAGIASKTPTPSLSNGRSHKLALTQLHPKPQLRGFELRKQMQEANPSDSVNLLDCLSPAAVKSLGAAWRAGYRLKILSSRRENFADKLVVLLGETHIKSRKASDVGKQCLTHFPVRMVEHAKVSDDLPDFTKKNIHSYAYVLNNIEHLSGGLLHSSTILEARSDHRPNSLTIPAEQGHQSDRSESVSLIAMSTLPVLSLALNLLSFIGSMGYLNSVVSTFFMSASRAVNTAYGVASLAMLMDDMMFEGRLSDHQFGIFVNYMSGIIHGRDRTIATNIAKALDEHHVPLLVIVGELHVPGIARNLEGAFKLQPVELPKCPYLRGTPRSPFC